MSVTSVTSKKFSNEECAVKTAMKRNGRIITSDLDREFKEAVSEKNSKEYFASQISVSDRGVKKHGMSRSASAFSIDRVFDVPHNPFRTRQAIETPQNIAELYQRFRYYYQREPLVGTAIELHSEFPLSHFRLSHEDPVLREEFNDICEDLNLFEFMLDMAHEYWLIGETFPFGIFDDPKQPQIWKTFVLLNPLNIDIKSVDITDGRPNASYRLRISQKIRDIVTAGPRDKITGDLYNRIPQDIKDAVKKDGYMQLNSVQISHFKRKGNYFKTRGESLLYRIMHLLAYRDKLRDSTYAQADRNISPREVWKIGEPNNPASEEELQNFSDMLSESFLDPSQAIVYHHAVAVEVVNTIGKLAPIRQELDQIEEEMLVGLMLNKGFLDSSYGAYANMSVALDVLISRYLTFRQRLERWQKDHVWAPICRIHNIYKPTQAELDHRIRIKGRNKRPWVPEVIWDKNELRDSTQKVNLQLQLREKLGISGGRPGFPKKLIYQTVNEDPTTIERMLNEEQKEMKLHTKLDLDKPPTPEMGAPDLGLDLTGLEAPIGEIPEEAPAEEALPEAAPVEEIGEIPGVEIAPPEAAEAGEFGVGAPGAI